MMARAKGIYSVLVLMRAWAIWGTGKRTSQVLLWSYVIYFIIQLAGALWTVKGGHIGQSCCFLSFLLFAEMLIPW